MKPLKELKLPSERIRIAHFEDEAPKELNNPFERVVLWS
jgi:hypothetical protein